MLVGKFLSFFPSDSVNVWLSSMSIQCVRACVEAPTRKVEEDRVKQGERNRDRERKWKATERNGIR